jgi:hypothetical protein
MGSDFRDWLGLGHVAVQYAKAMGLHVAADTRCVGSSRVSCATGSASSSSARKQTARASRLIRDRRGLRLLRALKRAAGWLALLSLPTAALLAAVLPAQAAAVAVIGRLVLAVLDFLFWSYIVFAIWLSRPDEESELGREPE